MSIILNKLEYAYPNARCELDYTSPYELLVAVVLSAQCTDKRVNLVTKKLFERAGTPQEMAAVPICELEGYIRSCGFYRTKAKAINSLSRDIIDLHGGCVPSTLDQLIALRGVGIKTAKVVLSEIYNLPHIAVDTHVYRVSRRLGLSSAKTPESVGIELERLIPQEYRAKAHHLLIFHGRYCCKSQNPNCVECTVREHCTGK